MRIRCSSIACIGSCAAKSLCRCLSTVHSSTRKMYRHAIDHVNFGGYSVFHLAHLLLQFIKPFSNHCSTAALQALCIEKFRKIGPQTNRTAIKLLYLPHGSPTGFWWRCWRMHFDVFCIPIARSVYSIMFYQTDSNGHWSNVCIYWGESCEDEFQQLCSLPSASRLFLVIHSLW